MYYWKHSTQSKLYLFIKKPFVQTNNVTLSHYECFFFEKEECPLEFVPVVIIVVIVIPITLPFLIIFQFFLVSLEESFGNEEIVDLSPVHGSDVEALNFLQSRKIAENLYSK